MYSRHTTQQGFVILFAVLISAIILLIGAGILGISVKESILSSSAREAQYAIDAADAGLECVLYADIHPNGGLNNINNPQVACLGNVESANQPIFDFEFPNPEGGAETCALVKRTSDPVVDASSPYFGTYNLITVVSRGFNLCNGVQPLTNDPLLVERVMRATFYKPNGGQ